MSDYSSEQLERLVVADERRAAALESLASQLPSLIQKLGGRGSGGNWNKSGKSWGLFKIPPALSAIPVNDSFQLPVTTYSYQKNTNRVCFYSPFTKDGELTDKIGVSAGSIKTDSKKWGELFASWAYDQSGVAKVFPLRIITLKVGEDREDKTRRFMFIDGIVGPPDGLADPEALTYAEPPAAPVKEGAI